VTGGTSGDTFLQLRCDDGNHDAGGGNVRGTRGVGHVGLLILMDCQPVGR
jgi:hypothetical protein